MVYFLLQMEWDGKHRQGAIVSASPPCPNAERAQAWRDTSPGWEHENRKRWVIGITNEELIAALGPGKRETATRVSRVRYAIMESKSPLRADMGEAALAACHDETKILAEALDDLTAPEYRHHYSPWLRNQWAAQLLMRTSRLAGEALNKSEKWPCTWTNPISLDPGKGTCRGRREEQIAVLTWRLANDRWPLKEQRVAFWWSQGGSDWEEPQSA